jgi:hypothetical protein
MTQDTLKRCKGKNGCEELKPASEFYPYKYGLRAICKDCYRARQKANYDNMVAQGYKRCRGRESCGETKSHKEFYPHENTADKLMGICKKCLNKRNYARKLKHLDSIEGTPKKCVKCGKTKMTHPSPKISDFWKAKSGKDGFRTDCKTCSKVHHQTYKERRRAGKGTRTAHRFRTGDRAYCESEMGSSKLYTGNYVRFWRDCLDEGVWPPGSIWIIKDTSGKKPVKKRVIVWGQGKRQQYAVEL